MNASNVRHFLRCTRFWKHLSGRNAHSNEAIYRKVRIRAELNPDLETKLETEELKPKNHPGRRKINNVTLPEALTNAMNKVIAQYCSKQLHEDSKTLARQLYHRQLPMEHKEFMWRFIDMMDKMKVRVEGPDMEIATSKKKMVQIKIGLSKQVNNWKPIEYTRYVGILYLISKMPGNYAALFRVFSEISIALPSFQPKTFFDFGSGVGTAVWAAHSFWASTIEEYFCVDTSPDMNDLSEELLKGGDMDDGTMLAKQIHFRQFLPSSSIRKYNLVVSAYSLLEMHTMDERLKMVDILWQKTTDMLVIIESGSRAGFSAVLDARDYIISLENSENSTGVHVVAPCPHATQCPKFGARVTCHVPVTYFPVFPKKDIHNAKVEAFSYVVLRRGEKDPEKWPRIVSPTHKSSKKVHCGLCCPDGKFRDVIFTKSKHGKVAYRCATKCKQGDFFPAALSEYEVYVNYQRYSKVRKEPEIEDENCTDNV